jgi:hypothetical protein
MRRELFFACVAATTACSVLVDLSGLAGSVANDAGFIDASDGATTPDVRDDRPTADAGSDVAVPRVCAATHAFCDDFDAVDAAPFAPWQSVTSGAGPLVLDPLLRVSAPNAMRIDVAPGSGVTSSILSKTVPVTNRKVTVSFDLRMDLPDGGFVELDPMFVRLEPAPAGTNAALLAVAIYGPNAQLEYFRERSDGGSANSAAQYPRPDARFHHYVVSIAPSGTTLVATTSVDGTTVATQTLETNDLTRIVVQAGVPFARDITIGPTVRIDNVVVDTGP